MTTPLANVEALWPQARFTRRPGHRGLFVLPSRTRPRMLVPGGVPGASVMLRRHSTSRAQTVGQELAALGVRTGLVGLLPVSRLLPGAGGVDDLVLARLPEAAAVGVLLGPPRANAKPVLQVFAADGTTVAFGKVGHDAAAAALVRREAAVLSDPALGVLAGVEVPQLLALDTWEGMPVLLMSAMSGAQARAGSWALPVAAIREVAESARVEWSPVGTSTYWADLAFNASGAARTTTFLGQLAALVEHVRLGFGRWHGDWAPWNSAEVAGRIQLWDWEQSRTSVPLGLDAVHFVTQEGFRAGRATRDLSAMLSTRVDPVLSQWYPEPMQRCVTVALYLAEITLRYERQALAAAPTAQLQGRLTALAELAALAVDQLGRAEAGVR